MIPGPLAAARILPVPAWFAEAREDGTMPVPAKGPVMLRSFIAFLIAAVVAACGASEDHRPLPPVSRSGELVVVTVNGPTTYFENSQGASAGLAYDLLTLFARENKLDLRLVVVPHLSEVMPALEAGKAHLAAAGLTEFAMAPTPARFGPPIQRVEIVVAYRTDNRKPASLMDLAGKRTEVVSGTGYTRRLRELQETVPGIRWHEASIADDGELLQRLAEGEMDYVVTDSRHLALARNFHPNIAAGLVLGETNVAWAFAKGTEPLLLAKATSFLSRVEQDGLLKLLMDRYFGHVHRLQQTDIVAFLQRLRTVLPQYRALFEEGEALTGIDWRLLAAVGYQESHWDPLATSPTNVRGLMMLTEETADRMNVTDRLDPRQSILAGARYYLALKDALPPRIPEPDRTWLAMAAYNIGLGHLEDGRILAQRMKLNPDSWTDVKRALPLLADSEHYSTLKHGFARGGEAVIMAESVRTYYDIISRHVRNGETLLPLRADGVTVEKQGG